MVRPPCRLTFLLTMKPLITLAQVTTPDGTELSLHHKDTHYYLRINREPLMATNAPESEREMARLGCVNLCKEPQVRVLIGGLGFGYTLEQTLALVRGDAEVHVAELLPEVEEWNRTFLHEVNGASMEDRRTRIIIGDVFALIAKAPAASYHAILLDVDNGPTSMVQKDNQRLYDRRGLTAITRALKPGGRVVFWSASPDPAFAKRLGKSGFDVQVVPAKAYVHAKRAAHTLFVADPK